VNGIICVEPALSWPVLMMHVDHKPVAMPNPPVPVRMVVRAPGLEERRREAECE